MRCASCAIAIVGALLGCASLTQPDGDELHAESTTTTAPTAHEANEPAPTVETKVALAAPQLQPQQPLQTAAPPSPNASKQGG
jgi:hypothetical protein